MIQNVCRADRVRRARRKPILRMFAAVAIFVAAMFLVAAFKL